MGLGPRYNVRQIMGEKSGEMKEFIKWLCEWFSCVRMIQNGYGTI